MPPVKEESRRSVGRRLVMKMMKRLSSRVLWQTFSTLSWPTYRCSEGNRHVVGHCEVV